MVHSNCLYIVISSKPVQSPIGPNTLNIRHPGSSWRAIAFCVSRHVHSCMVTALKRVSPSTIALPLPRSPVCANRAQPRLALIALRLLSHSAACAVHAHSMLRSPAPPRLATV
ncbi:hypothetical protein NUW54_g1044 [Trametes sanguinea]|uniref:Uncharacterized protein n=1 Tax=Trametes sanguinea TaxID=158606 RepID=A0ACC1Q9C4_9APHY|nr:hypothetical protein NUW54_g1044 [Trametes sanguinea]